MNPASFAPSPYPDHLAPHVQANPGLYARLLLSHVEALELALGDATALEHQVQQFLDEVAALPGTADARSSAVAIGELPWPQPGQVLWQPTERVGRSVEPVTVQHTFAGKDGRTWCTVELTGTDGTARYAARPLLALSETPDGPPLFHKALRQPGFAREFLQRAGILDGQGNLSVDYGG